MKKRVRKESGFGGWNHRLVREHGLITIREVYYKGGKPWLCDSGDKPLGGVTEADVKELYDWAGRAFQFKVLNFPKDFTKA